jgi:hypothetical protein
MSIHQRESKYCNPGFYISGGIFGIERQRKIAGNPALTKKLGYRDKGVKFEIISDNSLG